MKEARYYTPLPDKKVQCILCPHHCVIAEGKHGVCLTRQNHNGSLYSRNYCSPVATAIDPIEKKPLYHFHPGAQIFSAGPNGCTLKCRFCQNADISLRIRPVHELSLDTLTQNIIDSGTIGAAYTYSEPSIWFETIMDVGAKIKEHGLVNVMVTNGYIEQGPLGELLQVVDAMNIDIKSMDPAFYKKICKGTLEPVLRTCETVKKQCHLEITNLLITHENDTAEQIEKLVDFIAVNLGKDTPLHLSRYFPRYRMNREPTPAASLAIAWRIASEKLDYVYTGNVPTDDHSNTCCPSCSALLVTRTGYHATVTDDLTINSAGMGACARCNSAVNIVR